MLKTEIIFNKSKYIKYLKYKNYKKTVSIFLSYRTPPHLQGKDQEKEIEVNDKKEEKSYSM